MAGGLDRCPTRAGLSVSNETLRLLQHIPSTTGEIQGAQKLRLDEQGDQQRTALASRLIDPVLPELPVHGAVPPDRRICTHVDRHLNAFPRRVCSSVASIEAVECLIELPLRDVEVKLELASLLANEGAPLTYHRTTAPSLLWQKPHRDSPGPTPISPVINITHWHPAFP